jgi:hypothetical protein
MIRIRLFVYALLALAALVSLASAQTPPPVPTVVPGVRFSVQGDHDGTNTTHYRLFIDGAQVGSDVAKATALVGGVVTLQSPVNGVARGSHSVQIEAVNPDNVTRSLPLMFEAKYPAPTAPGGIRFVVVTTTADGTPQMQLLDLTAARQVLELPPLQ